MSLRPTRAYTGVTSPSQRLESHGVSTGTGIISRLSPRWRAYSRMISRYETRSAPPISTTALPSTCTSSAAIR